MFEILDDVCTPKRGTKYSAYVDLFSREDVVIGAGETKIVKLGVKLDLEQLSYSYFNKCSKQTINELKDRYSSEFQKFLKSHYLEVTLRSSLGVKGLIIANGIGIIDLDYPDEIGLIVYKPINSQVASDLAIGLRLLRKFEIKKGEKVAQCTLKEHKGYLMGYESDVIRDGGFGSTGN